MLSLCNLKNLGYLIGCQNKINKKINKQITIILITQLNKPKYCKISKTHWQYCNINQLDRKKNTVETLSKFLMIKIYNFDHCTFNINFNLLHSENVEFKKKIKSRL